MKLESKRLILIPCTQDIVSTVTNYEIGDHIKGHLHELEKDTSLYGWGTWFVINKETNQIIGDIGFKGKPDTEHKVEIGYGIHPSVQNKGYATEAVNKLMEWAFESKGVTKIIAECLEENLPSIKVLEKLGMNKVNQKENMINWEMTKI